LKTGTALGASGRCNPTHVGLHWDAFSFSIVASDSWVNPISRLNHSCSCSNGVIGLAVVAVVIGFVAVVIGFVAVVAVVALRLTTLAQDIG
jgi:hypothetical protein